MQYVPSLQSLKQHHVPAWYHDAKLGVFVHWGLYSVPAFAPPDRGESSEIVAREGWKTYYRYNPYAEWYVNSMKIPGSPAHQCHHEHFRPTFSYDDFVPRFNEAILTGSGKSFCSGMDLAVIGTDNLLNPRGDGKDLPDVIGACKKPIIGAVNGYAITGGFELALNCDFLIASERASFADTHVWVGLQPGWGMTQLLQQAVGQRMAKQISFTGEFISAQQALQMGLVNEVVAHDELLPRAREIALHICAANQEVLAEMKGLIEFINQASLQEALAEERRAFQEFILRLMETTKR